MVNKSLRIVGIVLLVLGIIIALYIVRERKVILEAMRDGAAAGLLEQKLLATASDIRKQLPIRVDEITSLSSVLAQGTTLTYSYRMDIPIPNRAIFEASQRRTLIGTECGLRGDRGLLKQGGKFGFIYIDVTGAIVGEIIINERDCAQ